MRSLPLDRSSGRCLALGVSDRRDHAMTAPAGRWTDSFLREFVSVIVQTMPMSLVQCNNHNGSGFWGAAPARQGATEDHTGRIRVRSNVGARGASPGNPTVLVATVH